MGNSDIALKFARVGACALALAACGQPDGSAPNIGFVFTTAGDYGTNAAAAATLKLLPSSGAAFHLALGDLSYENDRELTWCDWVRARVGEAFPFLLLAGNHEDDFGEHGHITRFAECLPDRLGVTGRYATEYYFDVDGLARVILISPDLTVDGEHYYYGDANAHYRWVANAIDGARATSLPWVIVGMHKSCISVGQYYCNIYSELMDLLLEKKVDLTLHGHEHSYQRTKQLALGPGCPSLPIDGFDAACVADGGFERYVQGRGMLSAISEFPKGRKYLISLSFRGKASVRPAQVGGFDVNIVIHGSTAVRGRGDLVAYRWALWKLTAPWTHRTRPPHLGKRCAFSTSSTGPFPSNHSRKTPKGPKIALGNPDRPDLRTNNARNRDRSL